MTAGIYSLANLAVAVVGTVMTSPMGPLSLPAEPSLDVSSASRSGYVIEVHSDYGSPAGRISSPQPVTLSLAGLPDHFINAVIAAEDERFLEHSGVDPAGVAGAAFDTLRGRLRGGSTITQQMVKNTITGNDRTLNRKVVEAMAAVRAHQELGSKEVLRQYLQSAWYGRGITGAMQAPAVWFGKNWDDVSLAECATLAAMLKGPALYDPWQNPAKARGRRNAILKTMSRQGWISGEELAAALAEPVVAIAPERAVPGSAWMIRATAQDLAERRFVPGAGQVKSTIDASWQQLAEAALAEAVREVSSVIPPREVSPERIAQIQSQEAPLSLPADLRASLPPGTPYNSALLLGRNGDGWDVLIAGAGLRKNVALTDPHPGYKPEPGDLVPVLPLASEDGRTAYGIRLPTRVEGAVVVLDPRTGRILASAGGVDAGLTEFDRTRALRQPGSAIKPFLFLAALSMGFDALSPVEDIERTWYSQDGTPWHPRNYDRSQSGFIPMYSALERSSNLASAFLIDRIGPDAMARRAEAAGAYPEGAMTRKISAALGTSEVSLRDLVAAYGAIVNDGMPRHPHAIEHLRDAAGTPVPEDFRRPGPIAGRRAIADLLGMMRGVVLRGTASVAFREHPVRIAGKTGTTQDWRDAWFAGVTPQIAIGVWLGRDDNKPLPNRMAGGSSAAPIAARILKEAFEQGLIDANGLRDASVTSSIDWPPAVHGGDASVSVAAARSVIPASPLPEGLLAPAAGSGISGFWGGLEVQGAAPAENRNGDILELLR